MSIALFEFNKKEKSSKPKRGKRMALDVSHEAPYKEMVKNATTKWKAFHSNPYDDEEEYMLLF